MLVFDELGVDHVFIDEAHYFKNLETPTKMERVTEPPRNVDAAFVGICRKKYERHGHPK